MKTIFKLLFAASLVSISLNLKAQTWQYTGALSSEKRFVIFTTLDNGKVLASGGMANDIPHAECELYDPATASWSLTGPLNVARYLHSVVKLTDGRVAIFGGQCGGSLDGIPIQTDVIEIYDPSTGIWTPSGHLQVARQHQTATLLADGRVLIAAGLSDVSPIASCEIYDPSTQLSVSVASMQQARYEHQATIMLDGRVIATGGRIGGWDGDYLNEAEIYDPIADSWTVIDAMHQARIRGLLVQFSDGAILCAAGRNSPTSTAPGSELYDLSSGLWTSTDTMKQPCTWLSCVLLPNDRYLATGGFIDAVWTTSTDVLATPTAEWYDKPNSRWFYAPTLNQARGEHASAYIHQEVNSQLPEDMVIIGGGITGDNTYTATCEVLDIGSNALTHYEAMPANQNASAGVSESVQDNAQISIIYDASNSPIIDFSLNSDEEVSIKIVSADGREMKQYDQGMLAPGAYSLALVSSELQSGAYMAIIQAGGSEKFAKLLIMH